MTLNLIESFKTSIYSPAHTKHTKIHNQLYKKQKSIFSKTISSKQSAFYADFTALFIFHVGGHTAQLFCLCLGKVILGLSALKAPTVGPQEVCKIIDQLSARTYQKLTSSKIMEACPGMAEFQAKEILDKVEGMELNEDETALTWSHAMKLIIQIKKQVTTMSKTISNIDSTMKEGEKLESPTRRTWRRKGTT